MNMLKKLYHFLGSIYLAIFLISTTAALVIIGTFVEASTNSHKSAALLTYSTPWFIALLCGFFLNILLSALRRWPFQIRHIPFLITHLGLLMIISGVMIKTLFGVQGHLIITEGSGSHDLFVDDSEALRIENREGLISYVPIDTLHKESPLGLSSRVIDRVENSQELLIPWMIGNRVVIRGLEPVPIYTVDDSATEVILPPPSPVKFAESSPISYNFWALKTQNPENILHKLIESNAKIKISETVTGKVLAIVPLEQALGADIPLILSDRTIMTVAIEVSLGFTEEKGVQSPHIQAILTSGTQQYLVEIPLDGDDALLNKNLTTPQLGKLPLTLDIEAAPFLSFIADARTLSMTIFGSDPHGIIFNTADDPKNMNKIYAYEEGFAGYTIQKHIPMLSFACSRDEREQALCSHTAATIDQAVQGDEALAPPLELFKACCHDSQKSVGQHLVMFLDDWSKYHAYLYPADAPLRTELQPIFARMEELWPERERKGALWASMVLSRYEPYLQAGMSPLEVLKKEKWPLVDAVELAKEEDHLMLLTQQIFQASEHLPEADQRDISPHIAREFSALLRAFGIHASTITPQISATDLTGIIQVTRGITSPEPIVLETVVRKQYEARPPLVKIEENIPSITIAAQTKRGADVVPLTFDQRASGLCWPACGGQYLLRFQPMVYAIPHHIRLRHARQVTYPNSTQPYSFEADVIVKDLRTGDIAEKTISMNHVHETDDGYRFYLGALYPPDEGAVKTVQIVVNRDPAKYWLTYPGAAILSLGIFLLFWMRPYKEKP